MKWGRGRGEEGVGRHVFVPELGGDFCDVYFSLSKE